MSTAEVIGLTKGNASFQKRDYRPWTVDILENTLEEEHSTQLQEDYFDDSPLKPLFGDITPAFSTAFEPPCPILIGGFLETTRLFPKQTTHYTPHALKVNYTGEQMHSQEELTLLKTQVQKLEQILKSERTLRTLLEEKILAVA
jgi:hypothetical protein